MSTEGSDGDAAADPRCTLRGPIRAVPLRTFMPKAKFVVESRFWLSSGKQSLCGRGRIELLERIGETGSIRQAAIAMGMSYRAAWDAVDAMNQRAGKTLITRKTGGARGGGAELSADGKQLIALYREVEREHEALVASLNRKIAALGI